MVISGYKPPELPRALNHGPTPPEEQPDSSDASKHGGLGGHIGLDGGEHALLKAKSALLQLKGIKAGAHQASSDAVDAALNPATQMAPSALTTGLMLATGTIGVASLGLGAYMLSQGGRDLKEGLSHGDPIHAIEGANAMLVGVRSLAAGVNLAGHLAPQVEWLAGAGHVAHSALAPLGVIHGSVDAALGLHEAIQGIRQQNVHKFGQGALGVGTGASLAWAAVGGGVPALVSAGACLAGKITWTLAAPQH